MYTFGKAGRWPTRHSARRKVSDTETDLEDIEIAHRSKQTRLDVPRPVGNLLPSIPTTSVMETCQSASPAGQAGHTEATDAFNEIAGKAYCCYSFFCANAATAGLAYPSEQRLV